MELNYSNTNKLGWQQRNELICHVYSDYNNHEQLNNKREEWNKSIERGNVIKWICELFKENRDLFGYFEKPNKIVETIDKYLEEAIYLEKYEIASKINVWRTKLIFSNC